MYVFKITYSKILLIQLVQDQTGDTLSNILDYRWYIHWHIFLYVTESFVTAPIHGLYN